MATTAGVSNSSDPDVVRAANGTWRVNITCADGQPPPTRALTSASGQTMWTVGYNCTATNYGERGRGSPLYPAGV